MQPTTELIESKRAEMTHLSPTCIGLMLALVAPCALGGGNSSAGKAKAESCAGCHGEDGNGNAPIFPKLAGQHPSYLAKQLYDFKTERRPEPSMTAVAQGLNDADVADLSAYFAEMKLKAEQAPGNEMGKSLFHAGNPATGVPACTGCHGPEGKGNEAAIFPAVRGQYVAYLTKTLHDFRGNSRYNDRDAIMRSIASRLTDQEINAVAEYLAGVH
jgi:cytochrome c553